MVHSAEGLDVAALGVSLTALVAALYPVVSPILEVRRLSKLSGEEVEAAVRPQEPMQNEDGSGIVKLFGEDALLDWPNAMGPGAIPPIIPSSMMALGDGCSSAVRAAVGAAPFRWSLPGCSTHDVVRC